MHQCVRESEIGFLGAAGKDTDEDTDEYTDAADPEAGYRVFLQ